ncbi:MAG: type II CAAX prenyl endopeptidase Rce1 family protein [Erythrobacter sp.]
MNPFLFFLLAIGGTWLFWLVPIVFGWDIWRNPGTWFLYAGGACVPLAGLALAHRAGTLRDLMRRVIDPRLIKLRWWLIIVLLVPVAHLLSNALAAALGAQPAILQLSSAATRPWPALLGLGMFLLILGPLPEEIGWRGYALPALLERTCALYATLTLGALWCLWHVPLYFMAGYYERFGGAPEPLLFFGNILIVSFFYTWIFRHTKGSVLAAVLFHFLINFTGEVLMLSATAEWIKTCLFACAAFAIMWCEWPDWRPRGKGELRSDLRA